MIDLDISQNSLNFSRPASGIYVQYYKFLRYGISGYKNCCDSMMKHADMIREMLKKMQYQNKNRFIILDNGSNNCLPVVTAMLNPECLFDYDDIDLQHALSQHHWYVSAYKMSFKSPIIEELTSLFKDAEQEQTMFRIVVKSNITYNMIEHLISSFDKALVFLDNINFKSHVNFDSSKLRHKDQVVTNHC
jgi:glutamate decarboxylase